MKKRILLIAALLFTTIIAATAITAHFLLSSDELQKHITTLAKQKTGRTLTIDGELNINIFPSLSITADNISLSNPESMKEGTFVKADALNVSIKLLPLLLHKHIVMDTIVLESPDITLHKNKKGQANWDFSNSAAASASSETVDTAENSDAIQLDIRHINITNGTVSFNDAHAKQAITLKDIELTGAISTDDMSPLSLSATLSHGKASLPLTFKGDISLNETKQAIRDMIVTLGDSRTTASLTIDHSQAIPFIKGQATISDLNIDELTAVFTPEDEAKKKDNASTKKKGTAGYSKAPIDVSALKNFRAELNITGENITLSGTTIDQIIADIALKEGLLDAIITKTKLYDGELTSRVMVNAASSTPTFAVETTIQSLPLIKEMPLIGAYINGVLTGDVKLSTKGNSVYHMVHNLSGAGKFSLQSGSFQGINLFSMITNISSAFKGKVDDKTEFSRTSASFTINKGVLSNSDLRIGTKRFDIAGEGIIRLTDKTIKYRLSPGVTVNPDEEAADKEFAARIPIIVKGKLSSPLFYPDVMALAPNIAKELQKGLKDVLNDPTSARKNLRQLKDSLTQGISKDSKNVGRAVQALTGEGKNILNNLGSMLP